MTRTLIQVGPALLDECARLPDREGWHRMHPARRRAQRDRGTGGARPRSVGEAWRIRGDGVLAPIPLGACTDGLVELRDRKRHVQPSLDYHQLGRGTAHKAHIGRIVRTRSILLRRRDRARRSCSYQLTEASSSTFARPRITHGHHHRGDDQIVSFQVDVTTGGGSCGGQISPIESRTPAAAARCLVHRRPRNTHTDLRPDPGK